MGFRCELCAEVVSGGTWVDVGYGLVRVCHPCGDVVAASVKPNRPPTLVADCSWSVERAPVRSIVGTNLLDAGSAALGVCAADRLGCRAVRVERVCSQPKG
jgi:hypothetical protein